MTSIATAGEGASALGGDGIADAVAAMGPGALTEASIREHLFPLFSRVLARDGIYLANHSLGRPLDRMADDVRAAVDVWYSDMDGAWEYWLRERETYRSLMARLIQCADADRVVPKTSAAQGLRAVLGSLPVRDRPIRVVTTRGEFDSIDFVLKAWAHKGRVEPSWVFARDDAQFYCEDIIAAIDERTDVVVVSPVIFVTGQALEFVPDIIARAHACGAVVVLDTYHMAGVGPVMFDAMGADFAIGGNYKYTRGGPGACWLAISKRHVREAGTPAADSIFSIDTGWFAKRGTFDYERPTGPEFAGGGDAWLEATPPVLTYAQAKSGLEFTLAVGLERLRRYNLEQQAFLVDRLVEQGVKPKLFEPRGAFLTVPHPRALDLVSEFAARGVSVDARPCPIGKSGPIRFCPDVLTTQDEMVEAARIAGELMR